MEFLYQHFIINCIVSENSKMLFVVVTLSTVSLIALYSLIDYTKKFKDERPDLGGFGGRK